MLRSAPSAADRIQEAWRRKAEDVKDVRLTPRRTDIRVTHFGLGWVPFWRAAGTQELLPAYRKPEIEGPMPRSAEPALEIEAEPAAAGA